MVKRIKIVILFLFIFIVLIFLFQFPISAQDSTEQNVCYINILPEGYRLPFVGITSFSTTISPWHKNEASFAVDFPLSYDQKVFASNYGTVIFAGWAIKADTGYGNLVKIKHPDGLISYYGHLSNIAIPKVKEGEKGYWIQKGGLIGNVGNTGNYSTSNPDSPYAGTHLHFHVQTENKSPVYILDSLPGIPNQNNPSPNVCTDYAIGPPIDTFCTLPSYIIAAASSPSGEVLGVAEVSKVAIPPPSKPSLISPYNWYQSLGTPPMLMWSGDNNSTYYYVVVNSSNTGNVESGWINSTSWKPNLPNQNYIYTWKVKAKNSQGVEGPWSDESHFSIASTTLKFEGGISFSPPSPSSADMIKIFASTTGWGGVGITLRVSINTAPDGSSNGEWKILKELGVPKFNEVDAPEWHTNGWTNGIYRIRAEAKGPNDPFWLNSAIIESTYTLTGKADVQEVKATEETDLNNLVVNGDFSLGNFNYWDPVVGDVSIYKNGGNLVAKCVSKTEGGTGNEYTDIYYHVCEVPTNDLNFSCRIKPISFQSGHIQIYVCLFSNDNGMVGDFSPIYYPGQLPVGSWTKISENLSSYPDFDMIIIGVTINGDNIVYLDDFKIY